MLRPAARMLQLGIAIPITAVLVCLGWWWWVPVPLALSFLVYEWAFWARADKPIELELDDGAVRIVDPYTDQRRTVSLADADSATLVFRRNGPHVDAVLAIADRQSVFLAVQFQVPAAGFVPRPEDVDVDVCNAVLGSVSGLIRALAPREAIVRQVVPSKDALDWFRAALPDDVFERTSVRGWLGSEPDLDLFGYHSQPADGLIRLEGSVVTFWDRPEPAGLIPEPPTVAERRAVLFRMDGAEHTEAPERLPLWVIQLGGRPVAIPAPLALGRGRERPLDDAITHTHPPEGAAILWHLWRTIPRDEWPESWHTALREARPTLEASSASDTVPPFPRWLDDQAPVRG